MGQLIGTRGDGGVFEVIILPMITERFPFSGLEDNVQGFAKAFLTFLIGDTINVIGAWSATASNAKIKASGADLIHCGHFFGNP